MNAAQVSSNDQMTISPDRKTLVIHQLSRYDRTLQCAVPNAVGFLQRSELILLTVACKWSGVMGVKPGVSLGSSRDVGIRQEEPESGNVLSQPAAQQDLGSNPNSGHLALWTSRRGQFLTFAHCLSVGGLNKAPGPRGYSCLGKFHPGHRGTCLTLFLVSRRLFNSQTSLSPIFLIYKMDPLHGLLWEWSECIKYLEQCLAHCGPDAFDSTPHLCYYDIKGYRGTGPYIARFITQDIIFIVVLVGPAALPGVDLGILLGCKVGYLLAGEGLHVD